MGTSDKKGEYLEPAPVIELQHDNPRLDSQSLSDGRTIGDYIITQQIGSGSFAVVWRGRHRVTGLEVAIKEISTEKLNRKLQESLGSEIAILRKTRHPNIIRLFEILKSPTKFYLVLEYCAGGDLSEYLRKHKHVPEGVARHFLRQLAAGLQVLRDNNLIHRDLKPQNLLLSSSDGNALLKIADFGFARSLQPQNLAETLCGSPLYMAPEILQFQKYDAKADLWSVGAILFELVTGRPPFGGANHVQLLRDIEKRDARVPDAFATTLSDSCMHLIHKLLRRNPVERLTFEEFFHHPFLELASEGGYGAQGTLSISRSPSTAPLPAAHAHLSAPARPPFRPSDAPTVPARGIRLAFPDSRPLASQAGTSAPTGLQGFRGPSEPGPTPAEQPMDVETNAMPAAAPKLPGATSCDSFECIEREYVVVGGPGNEGGSRGLDGFSPNPSITGLQAAAASPPITIARTSARGGALSGVQPPVGGSIPTGGSGFLTAPEGDDAAQRPPTDAATHVHVLQRCAQVLSEVVANMRDAGQLIEALAVALPMLTVWREALSLCHTWAAELGEKDTQDPTARPSQEGHGEDGGGAWGADADAEAKVVADACGAVEREFIAAVEAAQELESCMMAESHSLSLPNAIEVLFQAALSGGRGGAVEELMSNNHSAAVAYSKAATIFYFILVEAPHLPLKPALSLTPGERQRLRRYMDAVNARQHHCMSEGLISATQD